MPILKLQLNEIIEGEGFYNLYFQLRSDPNEHPEVSANGMLQMYILVQDVHKYEVGKLYDLNLNEIVVE